MPRDTMHMAAVSRPGVAQSNSMIPAEDGIRASWAIMLILVIVAAATGCAKTSHGRHPPLVVCGHKVGGTTGNAEAPWFLDHLPPNATTTAPMGSFLVLVRAANDCAHGVSFSVDPPDTMCA